MRYGAGGRDCSSDYHAAGAARAGFRRVRKLVPASNPAERSSTRHLRARYEDDCAGTIAVSHRPALRPRAFAGPQIHFPSLRKEHRA
jgi:hypothetical protein